MANTMTDYGRTARTRRTIASLNAAAAKPAPGPSFVSRVRPLRTSRTARLMHGVGRLDDCGRLRDAVVFDAVGLHPGTRVTVSVQDDRAVVVADDTATTSIDSRGRLALGETERKLLGLLPGERAVMSGEPGSGRLIVQPTDILDGLVA